MDPKLFGEYSPIIKERGLLKVTKCKTPTFLQYANNWKVQLKEIDAFFSSVGECYAMRLTPLKSELTKIKNFNTSQPWILLYVDDPLEFIKMLDCLHQQNNLDLSYFYKQDFFAIN